MSELTSERMAERMAREVEHIRKFAQSDKGSSSYCLVHSGAILAHIDAQADEITRLQQRVKDTEQLMDGYVRRAVGAERELERLRRERETLAGAVEVARCARPALKDMPTFARALALLEGGERSE